jgi:hypothetical protein
MKTFLFMLILLLLATPVMYSSFNAVEYPSVIAKAGPISVEDRILTMLLTHGVGLEAAKIILAQAKLESGHFSSDIFLENNNPFGMKQARSRETTAVGTHRGHAVYPTVEHAVKDYILWMQCTGVSMQETCPIKYVELLNMKKYFEDSSKRYIRGIQRILQEMAKNSNSEIQKKGHIVA